MGTIFEELVRRFNEENNEEAGEHWTPRDAVTLMAKLVLLSVVAWIGAEMEFPLSPSRSVRRCVRTQAVRVRSLCSGLFGRP